MNSWPDFQPKLEGPCYWRPNFPETSRVGQVGCGKAAHSQGGLETSTFSHTGLLAFFQGGSRENAMKGSFKAGACPCSMLDEDPHVRTNRSTCCNSPHASATKLKGQGNASESRHACSPHVVTNAPGMIKLYILETTLRPISY